MEKEAIIGLGSSIGDRRGFLWRASLQLEADAQIEIIAHSRVFFSLPLGPARGFFLNSALRIKTNYSEHELLLCCKRVERWLGREKKQRWMDRIIDIDILLYEDSIIEDRDLCIPHRALMKRSFAFFPALEVAPDFWHPVYQKSLHQLQLEQSWPCWPIGALPLASKPRTRYKSPYLKSPQRRKTR